MEMVGILTDPAWEMGAAGWVMVVRWEVMVQVDDEASVLMGFCSKSAYL